MRIFNIVVPKKYISNNVEKTAWNNVGRMIHFPAGEGKEEGFRIELNMFPEVKFMVFEQKNENQRKQPVKKQAPAEERVDYPEEDINPEDIPF